jgi:hypothetical protein
VLYEGREKIAIDLTASIQRILDSYKAGIFITSVTVQNVQPPEQVQASFDDAVKASQDQERLKSEGQAYANDIIEWDGEAWNTVFNSSTTTQATYITNSYTGVQYKWIPADQSWSKSFEGLYDKLSKFGFIINDK